MTIIISVEFIDRLIDYPINHDSFTNRYRLFHVDKVFLSHHQSRWYDFCLNNMTPSRYDASLYCSFFWCGDIVLQEIFSNISRNLTYCKSFVFSLRRLHQTVNLICVIWYLLFFWHHLKRLFCLKLYLKLSVFWQKNVLRYWLTV